ncbi:TrmB family transcriptional regulator [Isoptericola jiangsuensis]|uniref:TrmB family transcriptional regulator n=1 Tax=Isoptericola jiangsuensis TaxID=548579 RepID=UPI003AABEF21
MSQAIDADQARKLRALGLTEWEGKAYLALLGSSPSTGYAVAKISGVARGRIYEVLGSLVEKGAASVSNSRPQTYSPTAPDELVDAQRRHTDRALTDAEAVLRDHHARAGDEDVIWDLQGAPEILARAESVVSRAEQRLLCEIWSGDAERLRESLEAAASRGVEVVVVAYGDIDMPFATVFAHPGTDEVTRGLRGRWLVVSADDREVVAGNVSGDDGPRAAWTRHPGLVVPITELVRHDLYKLEMLKAHGPVLEATFGPALTLLRSKYGPLR